MPEKVTTTNQCNHINARGRRCRLTFAPHHDSLCTHHLKQSAATQPDAATLAAELLDQTGDLATASEINALLGNVAKQFARKHIDRKDAIALGYLSQLLLWSLPDTEKALEAAHDSLAASEANRSIAEMQARYAARRLAKAQETAAKAQETARNVQRDPSAATSNSSGPATQPGSPNAPVAPASDIPRPPRTYADVRS
jgi:hypothetical protein